MSVPSAFFIFHLPEFRGTYWFVIQVNYLQQWPVVLLFGLQKEPMNKRFDLEGCN